MESIRYTPTAFGQAKQSWWRERAKERKDLLQISTRQTQIKSERKQVHKHSVWIKLNTLFTSPFPSVGLYFTYSIHKTAWLMFLSSSYRLKSFTSRKSPTHQTNKMIEMLYVHSFIEFCFCAWRDKRRLQKKKTKKNLTTKERKWRRTRWRWRRKEGEKMETMKKMLKGSVGKFLANKRQQRQRWIDWSAYPLYIDCVLHAAASLNGLWLFLLLACLWFKRNTFFSIFLHLFLHVFMHVCNCSVLLITSTLAKFSQSVCSPRHNSSYWYFQFDRIYDKII